MGLEWLVIGAAVTLLLGGVGAMSLGASLRGNRFQDAMEAKWALAAEKIGGELEVVSRKTLEPRVLRIVAELDEVETVAALAVPVVGDGLAHTVVRADYVLGAGPRFVVHPRPPGAPAQKGMPPTLIADDPRAAMAAFGSEALALSGHLRSSATVTGRPHEIEIVWDGAEADVQVIESTMRLAAALARFGSDHLRALSTLDDATYEPRSDDGPRVRVRRGLVEVFLVVRAEVDEPIYVARTLARPGMPEIDVYIDEEGALETAFPEGVIDAGVVPELARVAPARMQSDEARVEIVWSEPPSLDQAKAAIRILAELGADSGSRGAFR